LNDQDGKPYIRNPSSASEFLLVHAQMVKNKIRQIYFELPEPIYFLAENKHVNI